PDGRLMTINGFELSPSQSNPPGAANPSLDVTLSVTTYAAPSDQGLTAGASPTGPGAAPTQPTSAAGTPRSPRTPRSSSGTWSTTCGAADSSQWSSCSSSRSSRFRS